MLSLFNLSLRINGFPIRKAKSDFRKIVKLKSGEKKDFIENQKKTIVTYHLQNNQFYSDFTGLNSYNTWEDLPVMTKSDLQKPLQSRMSKGFTIKNTYINKTSGSGGEPFIFSKDKYAHAMTWASNIYRFGWFGIDFNQSLQARFYGIPLDFLGNLKERLKDILSKRYRFDIFNLSDSALEIILKKFRNKKFDYINGYTSSIVLFAKFLQKKNIILKEICPSLKVCMVTSEILFESDRRLLETQFGIPIVNEYGASELDLIAFQNPQGEWQINSETIFVEILDENNQVLPYGQEGRIVITSLFNQAHPFIRYDLGDIGILDEKSTMEKPILKKLTGRTNDLAVLPSGKKSPGLTFYYVTKTIMEEEGIIKEFIIKQTQIDSFIVEYVSETELNSSQLKKIEKAASLYLEPNLHFQFIRKNFLERTNRGKLRQFSSMQ